MKEEALLYLSNALLLLPALIVALLITAYWASQYVVLLGGTAPTIPLP